ncbi:hypothetical protein SAMN05216420_101350 [Nitrosospira sp. Nl5]|uniref:hypothetical protein n=1 Tax=Nitrosospira sp. Nl5 TaxID=200120 RepID=UPI0008852AA0|nr:hypothetical protein [Nitrosospira sp. Nl5]SCX92479.1 hypothetical protein SAMN05216420_101350 [Nitrosospira sp. Nl5]
MANNITELRLHLFETIAALKDKDKPMDIDRAKAISDVAQVIINSAKAEVDYIKATGGVIESDFLGAPVNERPRLGVITHRLKG